MLGFIKLGKNGVGEGILSIAFNSCICGTWCCLASSCNSSACICLLNPLIPEVLGTDFHLRRSMVSEAVYELKSCIRGTWTIGPYFYGSVLLLALTCKISVILTYCAEPAISHDSHHVSLVQWTNLFASHHKGHRIKSPGGYLCETGILIINRASPPQLTLGPRADNVTVPLDLTKLSCPDFTLAAGLPSGFTTDGVGCWGGALSRACNLT